MCGDGGFYSDFFNFPVLLPRGSPVFLPQEANFVYSLAANKDKHMYMHILYIAYICVYMIV